jgi:hypothetical protein
VITEDTIDPNLLFLGTEFGLWISIDGGKQWAQYKGSGFPAVAVRDITIQPRESDLVLATHGRGIWIIDNISSLRALTPHVMEQNAVLFDSTGTQYLNASGGWPEGDATFSGPSRTTDAFITYYQKGRHIFGDMKIEVLDPEGKVIDTIAGSKHRGLNRATWSMRLKPPTVPPAASAAFGAAFGPHVLPGTYTVRMTKGDKVYTSKIKVVLDPRAPYNEQDRREQYDLAMKIYKMMERMSFAVDSMVSLRGGAQSRAAKLPPSDKLRQDLDQLAQQIDALRSKIVATKEGGAITGEERIREFLTDLYYGVNNYEGKPTQSQVERTDALGRELEDVMKEFEQLTAKQLPAVNSELQKKKLEPLQPLTQQQWEKMHEGDGGGQPGAMTNRMVVERD